MADSLGTASVGSTSSSLLVKVRQRDQDAWQRFVFFYGPLVDFLVRRNRLQSADARDVFQEVFRAVAEGIGSFRKERPSDRFRGWLHTITRNKLVDHFRRLGAVPIAATLHGVYDWLIQLQATMAALTAGASFVLFYGYVAKLREAVATRNTSDVDPQQTLIS